MISICLATRKRPDIFMRMCLSALKTADDIENIEFVSYHDIDDDSSYEYIGNHQEVYGERGSQSRAMNRCYDIAKGPIYMMIADDFVFETKGWDTAVIQAFEQYPDRIVLVWPDDLCYRSCFAQSLFIHKNWTETVGYLAAPYFQSQYIDNWWNDVARIIERKHFLRGIMVRHRHVDSDDVHKEYIYRCHQHRSRSLYRSIDMKVKREEDASKLLTFIKQFQEEIVMNKVLFKKPVKKTVTKKKRKSVKKLKLKWHLRPEQQA